MKIHSVWGELFCAESRTDTHRRYDKCNSCFCQFFERT